jgi:hypothetical protein
MPSLTLTPRGHLLFRVADDILRPSAALSRSVESAFARGSGHGLLELGAAQVATTLPADFSYWRDFATRFVTTICTHSDLDAHDATISAPARGELEALAAAAPPMTGAEYITASVLETLWTEIVAAFRFELAESKASVQEFLQRRNPVWHLVGRVHFNLAENRRDDEAPFAFLATYTTQLSTQARAQHLPLGRALIEYAGAANKSRLLSLLVPVQRAGAECPWLKRMVEAGEIYHPLRWPPAEAFQLLTDVPRLEAAGVVVRVPTAWRANRPPRPQVTATVGGKPPSGLGTDALLDFKMGVSLDGEPLTDAEIEGLLAASNGLHLICRDCSGAIDSLVELLQGRFSKGVMTRLCEEKAGLFPSPKEIFFTCSCPDWASMCKHVAAVLYGIGARLDHQPELLFTLRKVDQQDLIAKAGSGLSKKRKGPSGAKVLASDDLSEMFGIEMAPPPAEQAAVSGVSTKRSTPSNSAPSSGPTRVCRPAKPKEPAPKQRDGTQRLTPATRRAISERMRKYWAVRRDLVKKQKASNSS